VFEIGFAFFFSAQRCVALFIKAITSIQYL